MQTPRSEFEDRVDAAFTGREAELDFFRAQITRPSSEYPVINVHGVTGTGKSFLLRRFLQIARGRGLPTVKVQFDGKDGEGSVALGQHHEILRHIALGLGVPSPRFATAYLAWSLSKQFDRSDVSVVGDEVRGVIQSGSEEIINFLVTASLGPGGLLVSAARAGWRFVADRVSTEPLTAFHRTPEGRAFAHDLSEVPTDQIPSKLGLYLARDLDEYLPTGSVRAMIAFDSWEQYEEQFRERRSRWFQEEQVVTLFETCRNFIQFVIIGQRPISWSAEAPRLKVGVDILDLPLSGLQRTDAETYLRKRRSIDSTLWVEALLDISCETQQEGETRHHALTLGILADTAAAILANDPGASPASLEVSPGDLEALVRRFMSVREDQEPLFERLALTPRCDAVGLAAALGKPYDEFNALSDMDAILRYSFMQRTSEGWIGMHGLMRKMIRERIERYRPDKLHAAHSAWRRHYEQRGLGALAFRHALALAPETALDSWNAELQQHLRAGRAQQFADLIAWGIEAEDERPYLPAPSAGRLSLIRAWAYRECPLGDLRENLTLALNMTDRADPGEDKVFAREVLLERGTIYSKMGGLVWEDCDYYERALEVFDQALRDLDPNSDLWFRVTAQRIRSLVIWGRRSANRALLQKAVQEGEAAVDMLPSDAPKVTRHHMTQCLLDSIGSLGLVQGDVACFERVVNLAHLMLESLDPRIELTQWLEANSQISHAYRDLADYVPGTRELELSIEYQRRSLEVFTRSELPAVFVEVRRNIAHSLVEVGRRSNGTGSLSEAVAICKEELEHLSRDENSLLWSSLHGNMAKALCLWAERTADRELFAQSAAAYRNALEVRSRRATPFIWALGCLNLADALRLWHRIEPQPELLKEAEDRYLQALDVFSEDHFPAFYAFARGGLAEVRQV